MLFNLHCWTVKREQILFLVGNYVHDNFHLLRENARLAMVIDLFDILSAIVFAHLLKDDGLQVFAAFFGDFGIILEVRT